MMLYSPLGTLHPNTVITKDLLDKILLMYPNHDDIRVNVKLYADEEIQPTVNKLNPEIERDVIALAYDMISSVRKDTLLTYSIADEIHRIIPEIVINISAPGPTLLQALTYIADYDDYNTFSHSIGVMTKAIALGNHLEKLGLLRMTPQELIDLGIGSLLHDIGKTAIDVDILNKNGPLLPKERELMNHHPQLGYILLKGQGQSLYAGKIHKGAYIKTLEKVLGVEFPAQNFFTSFPPLSKNVYDIVLYHHERYDGTGYGGFSDSDRLYGKNIPPLVRITSIADVCDAILSRRPYKDPRTPSEALSIIQKDSGKAFDPVFAGVMSDLLVKHPIGAVILLDDGTIAVVDKVDPYKMDTPVCRSVTGILDKEYPSTPQTINLAVDPREIILDAVDIESLMKRIQKYFSIYKNDPMRIPERHALPFFAALDNDLTKHHISFEDISNYILRNLHRGIEKVQAEAMKNNNAFIEQTEKKEHEENTRRALRAGEEFQQGNETYENVAPDITPSL